MKLKLNYLKEIPDELIVAFSLAPTYTESLYFSSELEAALK